MIYIETGSDNVYHNFGLELYFAAEKKLDDEKVRRPTRVDTSSTTLPSRLRRTTQV